MYLLVSGDGDHLAVKHGVSETGQHEGSDVGAAGAVAAGSCVHHVVFLRAHRQAWRNKEGLCSSEESVGNLDAPKSSSDEVEVIRTFVTNSQAYYLSMGHTKDQEDEQRCS